MICMLNNRNRNSDMMRHAIACGFNARRWHPYRTYGSNALYPNDTRGTRGTASTPLAMNDLPPESRLPAWACRAGNSGAERRIGIPAGRRRRVRAHHAQHSAIGTLRDAERPGAGGAHHREPCVSAWHLMCQPGTRPEWRNTAMFLTIGALALPRSRSVAGRVAGAVAARPS